MNSECGEHEISMTKVSQSIQECCKNCLRILYFKQISGHNNNPAIYDKVIESEECCKLCGKSLYQGTDRNIVEYYKLCSDCYIIFSGYIESTFAEKQIMIFYLPWWHNNAYCDICVSKLKFVSDCQKFENSKNIGKYFLNELKSYQHFFSEQVYSQIIKIYGFTKDRLEDYILVLEYASGGDLHKYLQKNFTTITWNNKLNILLELSEGLDYIHKNEFIHRDFHSGNILLSGYSNLWRAFNILLSDIDILQHNWKIGDLGLSQSVDNKSTNNEVYGVIPYIAPEIFKGSKFSKEADIYSFGMVMWELTTGCKPFADVKHDIHLVYKILDGERPKITEDTPEFYANLMKSLKRMELIQSKKIGPEKCHPGAIYTSRPLSALISECYNYNYISEEQELDIKIESLSSQNLTIQNSLISLNKRNIEESNLETHDNNGKRIKTNFKNICCSRKII
ncbi:kinase-like domain-containing protein [Rhizophagus irregularis DAOM 181602=DAOM 197198]|nr:kinase-like domain-containing protein [Rhizophagus irregularis DAOM 181602=DAOM 197198]